MAKMDISPLKKYIDKIMDFFKEGETGTNIEFCHIRKGIDKESEQEKERCLFTLHTLIYNDYLKFEDKSLKFISLTEKGKEYIKCDNNLNIQIDLYKFLAVDKRKTEDLFGVLWAIIGIENEAPLYVAGSTFYDAMYSFILGKHTTYSSYIASLREEGKSTSRSAYYLELFKKLPEEKYKNFFDKLSEKINQELQEVTNQPQKTYQEYPSPISREESFKEEQPQKVLSTPSSVVREVSDKEKQESNSFLQKKKVFISYVHDKNKEKVHSFADKLKEDGIDVLIDKNAPLGMDLFKFMNEGISEADRVLIILTPVYKQKVNDREGGGGYECLLINKEIYDKQDTTKFIPVLFEGNFKDTPPNILTSRNGIDLSNEANWENNYKKLLEDLKKN